jgi:hypothetical protein
VGRHPRDRSHVSEDIEAFLDRYEYVEDYFAGVPTDDPEIGEIADDELVAAEWKPEPPASMDRFARPAIESYFE